MQRVPRQNLEKMPLAPGERLPWLSVTQLLGAATESDGDGLWRSAAKRARRLEDCTFEQHLCSRFQVTVKKRPVVGRLKPQWCVDPDQTCALIAAVLPKFEAIKALQQAGLPALLTELGVERAEALISASVSSLEDSPQEAAALECFYDALFGTEKNAAEKKVAVRHMRTSRIGGGTVLVFSPIDIVKALKKCDYGTAQKMVWGIFRGFYDQDLGGRV